MTVEMVFLSPHPPDEPFKEEKQKTEKRISTKTRKSLGDKVKETMTEVKMSGMRKRSGGGQTDETGDRQCIYPC